MFDFFLRGFFFYDLSTKSKKFYHYYYYFHLYTLPAAELTENLKRKHDKLFIKQL